ncbi:hypothetical protein CYMTET_36743 [Cymbomonas tetramitiformis]|uniref:Uncharacterized protein n=1 Tax=Cymbomonas tetramitiformis TaxID=36881 RepID=A0AAE0CGQ9_9CHLO|nr:hypothetical protein CYMTET_36743 [Cymbomonas tetramitiformis]
MLQEERGLAEWELRGAQEGDRVKSDSPQECAMRVDLNAQLEDDDSLFGEKQDADGPVIHSTLGEERDDRDGGELDTTALQLNWQ